MDIFGIGATLQKELRQYRENSQATGRSNTLIDAVRDGDIVVFVHKQEADRVSRILRRRGITIYSVVVPPNDMGRVIECVQGRSLNVRIFFDHTWLEAYYERVLYDAACLLNHANTPSRLYRKEG